MTPPLKPFRPNVGIVLFNPTGLVFAGTAVGDGPETVTPGLEWQFPQGGIDPDEDIVVAARRELWEETGIEAVSLLAVTEEWWPYRFPPYAGPPHAMDAFSGQTQRWVAFRFEGDERLIDVRNPPAGLLQEFDDWAWVPLHSMPDRVMPHKRENYERVVVEFSRFAALSLSTLVTENAPGKPSGPQRA